jgi:hypothetical protein
MLPVRLEPCAPLHQSRAFAADNYFMAELGLIRKSSHAGNLNTDSANLQDLFLIYHYRRSHCQTRIPTKEFIAINRQFLFAESVNVEIRAKPDCSAFLSEVCDVLRKCGSPQIARPGLTRH